MLATDKKPKKSKKPTMKHLLAQRKEMASRGFISVKDAARAIGVSGIRPAGLKATRLGTLRMLVWADVLKRYPKELGLPLTADLALIKALAV